MQYIADALSPAGLAALVQVILIDLLLAGDNIIVLGTLTAGMQPADRRRVLAWGIGIALIFLVIFALLATTLMHIVGLVLAGGILLLWVAWKLFREVHPPRSGAESPDDRDPRPDRSGKGYWTLVIQVVLADLSMSLDNVLAVAGAARAHPGVLVFGLSLSVTLVAVAAGYMALLIEKHRWLAYIGLAAIIYVAGSMIREGLVDPHVGLIPALT